MTPTGRVLVFCFRGESAYASRMELKLVSGDMVCCCSRFRVAARVLCSATSVAGMGAWAGAGALFLYREKLRCMVETGDALWISWIGGGEEGTGGANCCSWLGWLCLLRTAR